MNITVTSTSCELGKSAASLVAEKINNAVAEQGYARIVVSTGSSQFEMFEALIKEKVLWPEVEVFHLDEYIGLPDSHKASFRKYLRERFLNHVQVKKFHGVNVEGDVAGKIEELAEELKTKPIDLGIVGIGVNGHIAFNDPPADFQTRDSYIVVKLDDKCKLQQVEEGWFETVNDVPDYAVSMSVWQIMQCKSIISVVPHLVKANAVSQTLKCNVMPSVPATALKQHPDWHLFLDTDSASDVISFKSSEL